MAFISSVNIILWKTKSIGQVLPILHETGWQPWEDKLRYRYFIEVGDDDYDRQLTIEPEKRIDLVKDWDNQYNIGKQVEFYYQWQNETDKQVTVFFSKTEEGWMKLSFVMFPAWERLCTNVTDYSWYIARIACPLEKGDCGILDITCNDDNR